jgi:hypothetical protein
MKRSTLTLITLALILGVARIVLADGEPARTAVTGADAVVPVLLSKTGGIALSSLFAPLALLFGAMLITGGILLRPQAVRNK